MKIQILSDLHLEFKIRDLQKTDSVIIVLAGDIHNTYKRNLDYARFLWLKSLSTNKSMYFFQFFKLKKRVSSILAPLKW